MSDDANDIRFQYEVVKGLAESTRTLTESLLRQQDTLADIVQRLVRIEANEVNSRVKVLETKVEAFEAERNQRVGMTRIVEWLFKSPVIGWLVGGAAAAWLILNGKAGQ
jgi:cytosine/adenosine deaminase-related metal-dependent hydrolase